MQIVNSLRSTELDVTVLTDPATITLYKHQIAQQMNDQSGGPTFQDLSDRIGDIVIETAAQGASILEVTVIDPMWLLLISGFIQVDEDGFLWPPIELNFPKDVADSVWRLVACSPTSDLTQGWVLTFEDRIASALREVDAKTGGVRQSSPDETLGGFINRLVDAAAKKTGVDIRLVQLIAPSDPNYSAPVTIPSSANQPASNARGNPNKDPGGLSPQQQNQLEGYSQTLAQLIGISPGGLAGPAGGPLTLSEIEQGAADLFAGNIGGNGGFKTTGFGLAGNPIIANAGAP